jgi:PAS domain S-box-containing protein
MMHPRIKDYQISDRLSESNTTLVCRGHRIDNNEPALLKILKPETITKDERTRFRREFEMTSRFDLPGVVRALAIEDDEEGVTIFFEDIGGQLLDRILEQAPLSSTDALELAIALTDTVGLIHKQQIIHKDINPSNIIYNPDIKRINLMGFGLADTILEQGDAPLHPSARRGTLEYISPEQTGRMNRSVDYRTDFYSLGATMYRMLTGKPPFEAADALGLVHSHIAKTPVRPHELNTDIPEMVSRIVMKLLSKMADDRYQSAWGLKSDLEKCLRGQTGEGVVRDVELGLEDFPDRFQFPEKLYGREEELDQLFQAFERVKNGDRQLLLVSGYAGVGKTRLVREIQKTVIEKQGYFIEGKFDQLQQNEPYFAWIQALGGLMKYILMEGEAGLAQWKQNFSLALGDIGKVLIDVIPNLELVLGAQQDVTPLSPVASQNRFHYVFLEFIKVIATSKHPLAVFLDDLQWIDGASLNLLQTLISSTEVSNILIIGAYRDNEVDSFHPLQKTIIALRNEEACVDRLELKDLSEINVNELIADIVYRSPQETTELTNLIYFKTSGNPFFLRQILKTLVEKQAIFFEMKSGQWTWDIPTLQGMNIADNVVDLMLGKIRLLSPEAQRILPLAACIGFQFDLSNLGIIAKQPEDTVMASLRPALREGLIVPLGDEFLFVHDRVQQAAYSLIPDNERKQMHLKIGRLLLKHTHELDREEQLFKVVDHLNIGAELLKERNHKLELARLNLRAGVKARDSAAFSAAAKYFDAGVVMLDDESWKTDYHLTLQLHSQAADMESLLGDFEKVDRFFAAVTGNARSAEDMVDVYLSRMYSSISQGKLKEAVDTALEGYERLGLFFPHFPADEDIAQALKDTKSLYTDIPIEDLMHLPKMTDPNKLAIMRIHKMSAPAYITRPALLLLIILSETRLSIKYGNADESPNSYAAHAFVLCGLYREYDEGYRFATLALSLLETGDNSKIIPKTMVMIGGHVWHFRHHLKETLPYLKKGYEYGLKTGEFEMAGYDAQFYCINSYFAGVELQQLEKLIDFYGEAVRRFRAEIAASILAPFWQAIKNLLSTTGDPYVFAGEWFNQEEMVPVYEQKQNHGGLAAFYVNQMVLSYLFGNYEQALACSGLVEEHQSGMLAMFTQSVAIFYDSLIRLQLYPHRATLAQAQLLEKVSANQQVMKGLADSAPMNFLHKFYLVDAEQMRVAGEGMATLDYYDNAVLLARENGFIQEEALSNELAARFCMGKGKEEFARVYMKEAHRCYESWGAIGKSKDLKKRYPNLLVAKSEKEMIGATAGAALEVLDLSTLMKSTNAISSEIEMDKLLSEMMLIVIENASAERGFLLLEEDGVWQIVAKGGIDSEEHQTPLPVSLDKSDLVSTSVVRLVARTKESVVLDDASRQGEFVNDPHIKHQKTKSLLCTPLLSRGKLIGILYLENNLTTHAFTPERVQLLEMILAQAAISLENSRVYEALRQNEQKFRTLAENSPDNIARFDTDYRTIYLNPTLANTLGHPASKILGTTPTGGGVFKAFERYQEKIADVFKTGKNEEMDLILPDKGDGVRYHNIRFVPERDEDGRITAVQSIGRDITDRKQAEEELKKHREKLEELVQERTIKLEASNKELEAFAHYVSHDLRAPLRHIDGFIDLLQKKAGTVLDEKSRHFMDNISDAANKMGLLIDDLLSFSRMGRHTISFQKVALGDLVHDIVREIEPDTRGRDITWQIGDLPSVEGDASMLRIVMANLISNAVKFTRTRMQAEIEIGLKPGQNSEAVLFVRDNGVGFDMAYADKLFGVFQRLHRSDEFEGTGIGLANVRRIIQRHGGSIWAEGYVDQGATFYFSLPLGRF